MKMRFFNKSVAGLCGLFFASTVACNAVSISGEIHFGGLFSPINGGGTATSLGSATGIQFFNPVSVLAATGDFASIPVFSATFVSAFQFNPLSPSPVDPLWTVGGFSFTLESIQVVLQNNSQLNLLGTGYLSGNNFDQTYGTWNFTGNGGAVFSFSANNTTTPVPDGGFTLLLLGVSLLSIAAFASRRVLA